MPNHPQPDFPVPRILYDGTRERMHPRPWITDQGTPNENDPNPDETHIRVPFQEPYRRRVRPQNYKRGEDEEPPPSRCVYRMAVTAATDDDNGQTIYLKVNAAAVVYYGHTSEGIFSFSGNNPPACTGADVAAVTCPTGSLITSFPMVFTAWWNWSNHACGPSIDTSFFQFQNRGTCDVLVNGTLTAPGDFFRQDGIAEAPGSGDQHAFGGGSVFTVTAA